MASNTTNLGMAYLSLGEYHKAIDCYKKSLEINTAIGNWFAIASDNRNLANVYRYLEDYPEVMYHYRKSLEISTAIGDQSRIASDNNDLGNAHCYLAQYKKSIGFYQKALEINTANGSQSRIASNLGNLGNAYRYLAEYEKAIEYYRKGLEISTAIGDQSGTANNNGNLGNAYQCLGKCKEAIDCYKKGLEMSTAIGDQSGIANNNGNFGNAYQCLGEYKKAIHYYKKGLEISTAIGYRSGIASNNGNLGNVYLSLGEYEIAIDHYKKGLEISTAIGDQPGIASINGNLGNAYLSLGEHKKAIDYYKKGLEISTAIGDRSGIAGNNGNLGIAYQRFGENEKAIDCFKKCLELATAIGDRSGIASSYGNLGNAYLSLREYKKSIDFYKKSLEISAAIGNRSRIASNNRSLGIVYRYLQQYTNATIRLMTSINVFDEIFLNSVPDQNKLLFATQYFNAHALLMSSFIALDRIESALLVIDLGRAKELHFCIERQHHPIDMFSYARAMWNRIENKEESIVTDEIQEILHVSKDISILVFAFDLKGFLNVWILNGQVIFRTSKLDGNLETAWLIKKLLGRVHVNVNRYSSLYQLDSNTIHVGFPTIKSELEKSVANSASNSDISNSEILERLFKLLIDPVKNYITGNKIIIVPDQSLFFAPFSSLIDKNGYYLSNSHSIQITPSLHTLTSSMSRLHDTNLGHALFVGNPTVGKVILNEQELTPDDLPGAAEEVKYLSNLFEARPLLGRDATKHTVLELLGEASVIHIAAHGEPNKGEIMLAPTQSCSSLPKPDSYLLRQRDIESISVKARLVVLCCCHTGQGDVSSEGVIGITRAFLAAGARSVLAALWPISDHGTKKFMEKFYDELFQGTSVCEALRRTMNLFQTRESFEVWAPFTIYGEDIKFSEHELDEIKKQSKFITFLADFLNFYEHF